MSLSQYGFIWGPITITRIASDKRFGYFLEVASPKERIEIRVTPTGFIRPGAVIKRDEA